MTDSRLAEYRIKNRVAYNVKMFAQATFQFANLCERKNNKLRQIKRQIKSNKGIFKGVMYIVHL